MDNIEEDLVGFFSVSSPLDQPFLNYGICDSSNFLTTFQFYIFQHGCHGKYLLLFLLKESGSAELNLAQPRRRASKQMKKMKRGYKGRRPVNKNNNKVSQ